MKNSLLWVTGNSKSVIRERKMRYQAIYGNGTGSRQRLIAGYASSACELPRNRVRT
jgi:hypothetical protein